MTQAEPRFRTFEEYLTYEEGTERRYELVDGKLVELPSESDLNVMIAGFLFSVLLQFVPHYLIRRGTEIAVSSRTVSSRLPDLLVLTEEGATALRGTKRSFISLEMPAPLLVIEVVSPGEPGTENYDRDYIDKRKEYAARGIPEYWLIDPDQAVVMVLTLEGKGYRAKEFRDGDQVFSPTFPDLQLTADQILEAGR